LVDARDAVRNAKDWSESDRIRDEIRKLGFDVEDTKDGQRISER
jgi:cysteinyl-tRNA synthetase